ncbi:MAG TPA: DUF6232 family protein [Ohtaekwangia sp.]
MIPDKVLYTDGHDVIVTDETFQVKNHSYRLDGIIKHGLTILHPDRVPGIILIVLGSIIALTGLFGLIPSELLGNASIGGDIYSANTIAQWLGGTFIILGLLALILVRERYAVRISTAEGEKNAVVSHHKEYIVQIVNALNQALGFIQLGAFNRKRKS